MGGQAKYDFCADESCVESGAKRECAVETRRRGMMMTASAVRVACMATAAVVAVIVIVMMVWHGTLLVSSPRSACRAPFIAPPRDIRSRTFDRLARSACSVRAAAFGTRRCRHRRLMIADFSGCGMSSTTIAPAQKAQRTIRANERVVNHDRNRSVGHRYPYWLHERQAYSKARSTPMTQAGRASVSVCRSGLSRL
jgi:hypothetical protein